MAFGRLVNLFALSSLAVLVCSYGAAPVSALSVEPHDAMKHKRGLGHDHVAKRHRSRKHKKRQDGASSTCRTRSGSATSAPTSTWSDSASSSTPTDGTGSSSSDSGSSAAGSSAASSTTSSAAAATSSVTSSGGGKLGLAWPNGDSNTLSNFVKSGRTKYIYTWGPTCPSEASQLGLTCMPMLWSNSGDKVSAFQSTVVSGYSNIAMAFNEVNEPGQANMGVSDAVGAWNQYLQPLAGQGYELVAPVTSSNPNGFTWMQQFLQQCQGCSISYMPVHYYGTSATDMISYIEQWSTFGYPIMVTEFACQNFNTANENNGQQCSQDQVWDFYKTIVDYMESNSTVVAYFPFGLMTDMQGVNTLDQLMTTSSSGTDLWNAILNLSF